MIVIAILLIMTTLTVVLFNTTGESDRIRSSARQLQSALLGARDRAIRARAPRGLRLIVDTIPNAADPMNPHRIVTSMVYIGAPEVWRQGLIQVGRRDFTPADRIADTPDQGVIIVRGWATDWQLLFQQGLLVNGARIELPAGSGAWYTVDTSLLATPPAAAGGDPNPPDDFLILTGTGYRTDAVFPFPTVEAFPMMPPDEFGVGQYTLELQSAVLPGQEPLKLSSGIVVDIDRSQLTLTTASTFDIMFTPRGLVGTGPVIANGLVHFYLCTQEDAELNGARLGTPSFTDPAINGIRNPADPQAGEKLILTLFPQTGNISTFPVDPTDVVINATGAAGVDTLADDPFKYAKIGATASR